jgi:hypothetical protein
LNCFPIDNAKSYGNARRKVSLPREKPELGSARASPALKIDAKYQPCLVAFEVDEVKAGG